MLEKECLSCKKSFKVKPSHFKRTKYCSKKCMANDYKIRMKDKSNPNFKNAGIKKCFKCGKKYKSYNKNRKFCSNECYGISYRKIKTETTREKQIRTRKRINDMRGLTKVQKLEIKAGRKKPKQCELCGRGGKICFDHDHKTGLFRGWICHNCNASLGLIEDNTQTLELMIKYIQNNPGV
jgi:endogenous inhibitor of DNA gyrase (YacG/DUF329 family)